MDRNPAVVRVPTDALVRCWRHEDERGSAAALRAPATPSRTAKFVTPSKVFAMSDSELAEWGEWA